MSDNQLVQIVFPTSVNQHFRHLVSDAWKVLRELQRAGDQREWEAGTRVRPWGRPAPCKYQSNIQ